MEDSTIYSTTTVTLLHLLKIENKTRNVLKKITNPRLELFNPTNVEFTDDEKALLVRMLRQCLYHVLLLHSNTFVYHNLPCPPCGYSALSHISTPFVPNIYHTLFLGCSIVNITVNEFDMETWKKALKELIYDRSPMPIQNRSSINSPWIPCLGKSGWISVCSNVNSSTGEIVYSVMVVSGVDDGNYEKMEMEMYDMYRNNFTIQQAMNKLAWYREYAVENRRRLLYWVIKFCLRGVECEATISDSSELYTIPTMLTCKKAQYLDEIGCDNLDMLPAYVHLRTTIEEEEEEIVQKTDVVTHSIVPDFDFMLDDHIAHPIDGSLMLRLSNACLIQRDRRVIRIDGPVEQTRIYHVNNEVYDKDNIVETWLYSYPALSSMMITELKSRSVKYRNTIVTEDGLEHPIYMYGKIEKTLLKEITSPSEIQTLLPVVVRYSSLEYI
jgi:hypothetical protein